MINDYLMLKDLFESDKSSQVMSFQLLEAKYDQAITQLSALPTYSSFTIEVETSAQRSFTEEELDSVLPEINLMIAKSIKYANSIYILPIQTSFYSVPINYYLGTESNICICDQYEMSMFDRALYGFRLHIDTEINKSTIENILKDINTTSKIKRAYKLANGHLKTAKRLISVFRSLFESFKYIVHLLIAIKNLAYIIRTLSLAFIAQNRMARSLNLYKWEPPVGGEKVGGGSMAVMLPRYSTLLI